MDLFFFKENVKHPVPKSSFAQNRVKFRSAFYCAFDFHTKNEIIYHFVIHLPITELFLTKWKHANSVHHPLHKRSEFIFAHDEYLLNIILNDPKGACQVVWLWKRLREAREMGLWVSKALGKGHALGHIWPWVLFLVQSCVLTRRGCSGKHGWMWWSHPCESACIVSPRESDDLVGIRTPSQGGWSQTGRPARPLSALLARQGPPAFCTCILGLCLKSVLFPGLTSKLPLLRPRGALGLCSGLAVLGCLQLLPPSSWSPACTLPIGPAQGLGNCPALQAPVAQISSVFTGLINLWPLVPCLWSGAGLQTSQPGKLQQEPVTVRSRKGKRLKRQ